MDKAALPVKRVVAMFTQPRARHPECGAENFTGPDRRVLGGVLPLLAAAMAICKGLETYIEL